jgi:hypothetical protein
MAQQSGGQAIADAAVKAQARQSAERTWRCAGPFSTCQDAAAFANVDPAQGPGEVSFCCMNGQFFAFWYY